MKIVYLDENQKQLFADFDPYEMLDRKRTSSEFCLGTALEENGLIHCDNNDSDYHMTVM